MRIHSETNGRSQPATRLQTEPFNNELIEAKINLVTAVLAGQSSYVQGEDSPLRYRLLTETALRLVELEQMAAYFDLSDLAYQYDLAAWVQNSIRLLAIQLNLPLPTASWWARHGENDPATIFVQFLEENVLPQLNKPVLLSFDEADQLMQAPLAAGVWRLLNQLNAAQLVKPGFKRVTVVLWGKAPWEILTGNGRFPNNRFKQLIL